MADLPMFPLGMALLPGSAVPLQVFEPRFVAMIRDLLAADADVLEFGVVLIERGHEVGGGDVRAGVATRARVAQLQAMPGDRYALVAVGVGRITVEEWLDDDPYPRARVEPWPEPASDPSISLRIDRLLASARALSAELVETGHDGVPDIESADDDVETLYRIASLTPLGPADRYRVLAAQTLATRCDEIERAIGDAKAVLDFGRS
jgi:Lon protease-like protein